MLSVPVEGQESKERGPYYQNKYDWDSYCQGPFQVATGPALD